MSKIITDENQLNTEVDDLITEDYALEVLGLKNPADFRKFSRSFMKLSKIVKDIENVSNKVASKTELGRVKIGDNLTITEDGVLSGNPEYTHPTQAGYKHIPAGGTTGQVLKNNGDGSAEWGTLDIKDKLDRGNLPATIPDGKTIYDLLENNGGINIDTALLYLNDAGTKTQGKVYFDRNKKGLFECIQTTTSTTNSTTYFVDISNKASSDRLAKLNKVSFSNIITGECEDLISGSTFNFLEDVPNGSLLYAATGLTSDSTYTKSFFIFNKNDSMVIPTYHGNIVLKYLSLIHI